MAAVLGANVHRDEVIDNWKDEQCVVAEGDFDASTASVFALLRAMETGTNVAAARQQVETGIDLQLDADLLRMKILSRRLAETETTIAVRSEAAQKAIDEVQEALKQLASITAAQDLEWEELRELPALLEQHVKNASLAKWHSKIAEDKVANEESMARLAEATCLAEELRASFHFLLHKISHVATASERLSTTDRKRARLPLDEGAR